MSEISNDTLALVAAQLTTAWAIKSGIENEDRMNHTARLIGVFDQIHTQLKGGIAPSLKR